MSAIRVLPAEVSNTIAAGEVIERPASIVKELVDNSIDAGAGRITVQAVRGGKQQIRVSDDGCGMDRDDAMLCLEAHATSKIRACADVGQIDTLGFRGEALPSIAAVSRFKLQTRPDGEDIGTELFVENGQLQGIKECGCAAGTDVWVSHIFGNLPARRKFLKSPSTEEGHIHETVLLQALAHPDTAFILKLNRRQALNVPVTADLGARIAMLLGRETFSAMLPVDYEESGVKITGFAARPGFTRSTRKEQRLIINGRPADARTLYYGIRDAYHTMVARGRYPPVVLCVTIAPDRVDVNIHPAKREVRFREPRLIGKLATAAVGRALRELAVDVSSSGADAASRGMGFGGASPFSLGRMPEQRNLGLRAEAVGSAGSESARVDDGDASGQVRGAETDSDQGPPPSDSDVSGTSPIEGLRVMDILNQRYLVAEGESGLVLIDQRAAHERILFEEFLKTIGNRESMRQQLLFPVTIDLSPEQSPLMREFLEHFDSLGFSIEPFGGNTFLITAVPAHFPQEDLRGILQEILLDLGRGTGKGPTPDEVRLAMSAARHAVRSSDALDREEIDQLLRDLAAAEMPYTSPGGRSVMVNLPFDEIERRFKGRSR